jgi:mannosylglycerate hydrolase
VYKPRKSHDHARVNRFLVSHTHWDREWYRTFQSFRARLVDAVDRVLDLAAVDDAYRFVLDGQTIVVEDYLEVRPSRRAEIERAVRASQIAIGPWYVQPDSLMPSGEALVRNLIEGKRAAKMVGDVSRVLYTPDSFGHPARMPMIARGFGCDAFVYWRGDDDASSAHASEYVWSAADGSDVTAVRLSEGYFAAASLGDDVDAAADRIAKLVKVLESKSASGRVVLMNGADHLFPDAKTRDVVDLLEARGIRVKRALLDEAVRDLHPTARYQGELVGATYANLLAGTWSARTPLKIRNRACEILLEGWAEPWAAFANRFGAVDERASLRSAWRSLLANQAHDSLCGCSNDRVHDQMQSRYDASQELAYETTTRALERIAGLGTSRETPWSNELTVAVFNPSPHVRTDVVRFPVDVYPPYVLRDEERIDIHPFLFQSLATSGFTVDGQPARVAEVHDQPRFRLLPEQKDRDIEFIAKDIAPFSYRTFALRAGASSDDVVDAERSIGDENISVSANNDGTFDLKMGSAMFTSLGAIDDVGDRGDTYDFDPVTKMQTRGAEAVRVESVSFERRRHASGIEQLSIVRMVRVPERLTADRNKRSDATVLLRLAIALRIARGVARADCDVTLDNAAEDHRLRLVFPTGAKSQSARARSTFEARDRNTTLRTATASRHPLPTTFVHQGWVAMNGLAVIAPGLYEADVTTLDGHGNSAIAITLLRSVGWISRGDLTTRPGPAGPAVPVPAAQCKGEVRARLSFTAAGTDAELDACTRDFELGLRAVAAGNAPIFAQRSMLVLESPALALSAIKPSDGDAIIVRLLNTTSSPVRGALLFGYVIDDAHACRLDETRDDTIDRDANINLESADGATRVSFDVRAHAALTLHVR